MHCSTRAIVFKTTKFSDSKGIAHLYTEQFGLLAFFYSLSKGRRGSQISLFQPLNKIEIEFLYKEKNGIHNFKEARIESLFKNIHLDIYKNTILLFMNEVLHKCIKEHEPNDALYLFIHHALGELDVREDVSNFPILFLLELSKYLGFHPECDSEIIEPYYFDMQNGVMTKASPAALFMSSYNSSIINNILLNRVYENQLTNSETRRNLLNDILLYYKLHLNSMQEIKSLKVLEEILHS